MNENFDTVKPSRARGQRGGRNGRWQTGQSSPDQQQRYQKPKEEPTSITDSTLAFHVERLPRRSLNLIHNSLIDIAQEQERSDAFTIDAMPIPDEIASIALQLGLMAKREGNDIFVAGTTPEGEPVHRHFTHGEYIEFLQDVFNEQVGQANAPHPKNKSVPEPSWVDLVDAVQPQITVEDGTKRAQSEPAPQSVDIMLEPDVSDTDGAPQATVFPRVTFPAFGTAGMVGAERVYAVSETTVTPPQVRTVGNFSHEAARPTPGARVTKVDIELPFEQPSVRQRIDIPESIARLEKFKAEVSTGSNEFKEFAQTLDPEFETHLKEAGSAYEAFTYMWIVKMIAALKKEYQGAAPIPHEHEPTIPETTKSAELSINTPVPLRQGDRRALEAQRAAVLRARIVRAEEEGREPEDTIEDSRTTGSSIEAAQQSADPAGITPIEGIKDDLVLLEKTYNDESYSSPEFLNRFPDFGEKLKQTGGSRSDALGLILSMYEAMRKKIAHEERGPSVYTTPEGKTIPALIRIPFDRAYRKEEYEAVRSVNTAAYELAHIAGALEGGFPGRRDRMGARIPGVEIFLRSNLVHRIRNVFSKKRTLTPEHYTVLRTYALEKEKLSAVLRTAGWSDARIRETLTNLDERVQMLQQKAGFR